MLFYSSQSAIRFDAFIKRKEINFDTALFKRKKEMYP